MDDVVRTKAVEIVNDQGRMVMRLASWSDGQPTLTLYDARDGLERISISVQNEGQGLAMMAADGSLRIGLGVNEQMGTGINLFDSQSQLAILIRIDNDSQRSVTVFDQHGQVVERLGRREAD